MVVGSIQFTPTMNIVGLIVQGDWILVIFQESCRLFHFDIGFSQRHVVAEFRTTPNKSHKDVQVTMCTTRVDSKYSKLTVAYNDADKCGKINIVHIMEEDFIFGRA